MSLLLGLEPFQKFTVGDGGGWSKGILAFRFGPNLGFRTWSFHKLNKNIGVYILHFQLDVPEIIG